MKNYLLINKKLIHVSEEVLSKIFELKKEGFSFKNSAGAFQTIIIKDIDAILDEGNCLCYKQDGEWLCQNLVWHTKQCDCNLISIK